MLLAGVVALGIQLAVKVAALDPVVLAGFEVDDHPALPALAELADARDRQGHAGVGAGAADLADEAAVGALVQMDGPAEQHGHGVVEDDGALAGDPAALQLGQQRRADKLALAVGDDDLLVDADHAAVPLRGDGGGVGEAEADHVGAVHQRLDAVGGEADELVPAAALADAGHAALQHIRNHGPVLGKAHERAAEIGPARVDDHGAGAVGQRAVVGQIGGDHLHGAGPARKSALHLLLHGADAGVGVDTFGVHAVSVKKFRAFSLYTVISGLLRRFSFLDDRRRAAGHERICFSLITSLPSRTPAARRQGPRRSGSRWG